MLTLRYGSRPTDVGRLVAVVDAHAMFPCLQSASASAGVVHVECTPHHSTYLFAGCFCCLHAQCGMSLVFNPSHANLSAIYACH